MSEPQIKTYLVEVRFHGVDTMIIDAESEEDARRMGELEVKTVNQGNIEADFVTVIQKTV